MYVYMYACIGACHDEGVVASVNESTVCLPMAYRKSSRSLESFYCLLKSVLKSINCESTLLSYVAAGGVLKRLIKTLSSL